MSAFAKRLNTFFIMGVPELDQQHKELFDAILRLHEAMLNKSSRTVIDTLIAEFRIMLSSHFAYEENFLKEHGVQPTKEHTDDHLRMIYQFEKIASGAKIGLSIRLMDFFYTSLFTHIEKLDSICVRGIKCQQMSYMQ